MQRLFHLEKSTGVGDGSAHQIFVVIFCRNVRVFSSTDVASPPAQRQFGGDQQRTICQSAFKTEFSTAGRGLTSTASALEQTSHVYGSDKRSVTSEASQRIFNNRFDDYSIEP